MGWLKKESAYERRIRELEEEADRIRKNMQAVMKNVPRDGVTGASFTPGSLRTAGAPARPASATPSPPDPAPVTAPSPPPPTAKLASYLASGSFGRSGSPSRERRIQRNKALIMLAVMLMLLYIFFTWAM